MDAAPASEALLQVSRRLQLSSFAVTCVAASGSYVALGSASSLVRVLRVLPSGFSEVFHFHSGRRATLSVAFDETGEFVVVSDLDGSVSVRHASTGEERHTASFFGQVVVALDPRCAESKDFAFAAGAMDGRVTLSRRSTWFGSSKVTEFKQSVSFRDDGDVRKLAWRSDLVAWTTSRGGLRVYNVKTDAMVFRLSREEGKNAPQASASSDCLVWEDDETLLVGWGARVGVVRIRAESVSAPDARGTPPLSSRAASVLLWLEMTCAVQYVCPFGPRNGRLVIIGVDGVARLVERHDGVVVSTVPLGNGEGNNNNNQNNSEDEDDANANSVNANANRESGKVARTQGDDNAYFVFAAHDAFWHAMFAPLNTTAGEGNDVALMPQRSRPLRSTVQEEAKLPFLFCVVQSNGSSHLCVIRSRTIEDSLQFALATHDFERAMSISRGAHAEKWCSLSPAQVADAWLAHLVASEDYAKIPDVIVAASDASAWVRWCAVLAERRQLKRVVDLIPKSGLPQVVYDAALSEVLAVDTPEEDAHYVLLLRGFLPSIDAERAASEILDATKLDASRVQLKTALVLAYSSIPSRSEDAFWAMLDSQSRDAFDVLDRADGRAFLIKVLQQGRLADLCRIDEDRTVQVLMPYVSSSYASVASSASGATGTGTGSSMAFAEDEELQQPPHAPPHPGNDEEEEEQEAGDTTHTRLVRQGSSTATSSTSSSSSPWSFAEMFPRMIRQLCEKDASAQQQPDLGWVALRLLRRWNRRTDIVRNSPSQQALFDLEVDLCAKHDPTRLLELLRDANGYSPDKALARCRFNEPEPMRKEMVFLLQRIGGSGNAIEALDILVNQLGDLDSALEYAERDNLFDELVRLCVASDAQLVRALLSRAGNYSIDPARLVRALPVGLPDVRASLVQLFRDVHANLATRRIAKKVFVEDDADVVRVMHRQFKRGCRVLPGTDHCELCGKYLEAVDDHLVVFRTGDTYHQRCLKDQSELLGAVSTFFDDVSGDTVKRHCIVYGMAMAKQNSVSTSSDAASANKGGG